MKFIKNYIITASLAVFLIGCNYQIVPITPAVPEPVKPRFQFGNYETSEMRKIWGVCYMSFMQSSPFTPPEPVAKMCDCYVDQMRMSHSQKDINNLSDNETKTMGLRLIKACNVKQEPKVI